MRDPGSAFDVLVWGVIALLAIVTTVGVVALLAMAGSAFWRWFEWHEFCGGDVATPERLHLHGRYGPARPSGESDAPLTALVPKASEMLASNGVPIGYRTPPAPPPLR